MTSPREQAIEAAAEALMKRTMSPDDKTSPAIIETWMASTFRPDARAAIDAYEITRARIDGAKMEGWQPIETAPKSRNAIIDLMLHARHRDVRYRKTDCYWGNGWQQDGRWICGKHYYDDEGDECYDQLCEDEMSVVATHWRYPPAMHDATPKMERDDEREGQAFC